MESKYPKGHQVALVVKRVDNRLDKEGQHKKFARQDHSIVYVFDIEFIDGYKAEYCYPGPVQGDFVPGKITEFKVIDVNGYGATIKPIDPINTPAKILGTTGMSGHPAVFAMGFAKDLAPNYNWEFDEVFLRADAILEWLLTNKHKTDLNA